MTHFLRLALGRGEVDTRKLRRRNDTPPQRGLQESQGLPVVLLGFLHQLLLPESKLLLQVHASPAGAAGGEDENMCCGEGGTGTCAVQTQRGLRANA